MNVQPRRVEHLQTDKGNVPVYTTAVVEQPWSAYTSTDHEVWSTLFKRQREILVGRASDEFLRTQEAMGMTPGHIPKFDDLNRMLRKATGWELVGVEGLLPELTFFDHLANRRFPVTWWIRKPEQLDYLAEPDLFHDLFGHVPLLMNPVFADYMQAYGKGGIKAHALGAIEMLARLYWYTVEFGLIDTPQGIRTYGAGILSSGGEISYCIESPNPNRIGFDLLRIMQTRYKIDTFQETYFVIRGFGQLFEATAPDFTPYYEQLRGREPHAPSAVLATDTVYHRGIAPQRAA